MAGFQRMSASFNLMLVADYQSSNEPFTCDHFSQGVCPVSGLPATVPISPALIEALPKEIQRTLSEMFQGWITADHAKAISRVSMCISKKMSMTELRREFKQTYKNWDDMKQRCKSPQVGDKCAPQLDPLFLRFFNFLAIMGPRPHESWSLDRIKPRGPYTPENLRWADKKTQSRNRTNTIYLVDTKGARRPLVEWAEVLGVTSGLLRSRRAAGWSDEEILCGKRHSGCYSIGDTSARSGRDPLLYTPWPHELREALERNYQRYGLSDEHRLSFMKRYSAIRMSQISEQASALFWADEYEPSEDEQVVSKALSKKYDKWHRVYLEAINKMKDKAYRHFPYGRATLPNWVEQTLCARFGGL